MVRMHDHGMSPGGAAAEDDLLRRVDLVVRGEAFRRPKDFAGLETVDEATKKAILNFSHYLTVGNMDEAYNSVRNINNKNNKTVWQNMA